MAATDANASGALAGYEQAVLLALEDTENALVVLAHARIEDQHLERAARTAPARRNSRGCVSTPGRPTCSTCWMPSVLSFRHRTPSPTRARATATALVGLYRALAGGWPARVPERVQVSAR